MIQIRQFTPTQLKLYGPDGFIGLVNNRVESLQVRLDIAKEKLDGYYFMYGDIKITIDNDGLVDNWPTKLYSEGIELAKELYSIK
jgi:hypothetical protein